MMRSLFVVGIAILAVGTLIAASSVDVKYDHGIPRVSRTGPRDDAAVAAGGGGIPGAALPNVGSPDSVVPAELAGTLDPSSIADPAGDGHATPLPACEVSATTHDFGIVEPLRTHRHAFEIRNRGTAPLKLELLGTSCKCLDVSLSDSVVSPGGVGRLEVAWNAEPSQEVFLQRVTLKTNDPQRGTIDLEIHGRTKLLLAAEPAEFTTLRIKLDEPTEVETQVISQAWDAFAIEELRCSIEGARCDLTPLDDAALAAFQAKSGWKLTVVIPPGLPTGPLREWVRFAALPSTQGTEESAALAPERVVREIPIEGKVPGRVALFGAGVQPWGAIEIGSIPQEGYQGRFVVKISDLEPELRTRRIVTEPDFMEVNLEPATDVPKPGLYRLTVTIPATGTPGVYQGDTAGKLALFFDHPRVESLQLDVSFVLPRPPVALPATTAQNTRATR